MNQKIPVLMYHSVGVPNKNWNWNYLTCPFNIFEEQLKWLKRKKYSTINLNELYNYIFLEKSIPKKSIILTFDDGYADNWIYAYPLLKKYGYKGTIFVNPEFVEDRDILRTRVDENSDTLMLKSSGFLSWTEMKAMENDGVMDIQSHAMTHTHYPVSNSIIDYRNPKDEYVWLTWNNHKDSKSALQIDDKALKNLGEPVYEMGTSLAHRQFYPDKMLTNHLIDFVKTQGGKDFFNINNWKKILDREVKQFKHNNTLTENFEGEQEWEKRIHNELFESKEIISKKLNKSVDFLCWPEGSGTKFGNIIANKIGYKMTTAAKDIPKLRKIIPNSPQMKINRIRRISPVSFWNGIEGYKSQVKYSNGFDLGLKLLSFKNILLSKYWANILLIIRNKLK